MIINIQEILQSGTIIQEENGYIELKDYEADTCFFCNSSLEPAEKGICKGCVKEFELEFGAKKTKKESTKSKNLKVFLGEFKQKPKGNFKRYNERR